MKTSKTNNSSLFQKVIYIIFAIILVIGLYLGIKEFIDSRALAIVNKEQIQISKAITNTINEQAKLNLLMPEIVFVNIDPNKKNNLLDSLKSQIVFRTVNRIIKNDKIATEDFMISEPLNLSEIVNRKGNYILTDKQAEDFRNHVKFLTMQIENAVKETKDEINKENDKINTWVTIWIGVAGILGIFVPLVINLKAHEDLKETSEKSKQAFAKTSEIEEKVKEIDPKISKYEKMSDQVYKLEKDFNVTKSTADSATSKSKEALNKANSAINRTDDFNSILNSLKTIVQIKGMDPNTLIYQDKPLKVLIINLQSILASLRELENISEEATILEICRHLSLQLHLLSFYNFIDRKNVKVINDFAENLSATIQNPFNQNNFKIILEDIKSLIEKLSA